MARYPSRPKFDNGPLLTAAGEIDMDYLRKQAHLRAAYGNPSGEATPTEVLIWEDKLLGMAHMLRTSFNRDAELQQRFAVSALIGECEAIAASGTLTAPAEQSLRLLIETTTTAFDMPARFAEAA